MEKRPKLTDPAEYALIKQIYFKEGRRFEEEVDQIEKLERMEAKQRNNNKSPRWPRTNKKC